MSVDKKKYNWRSWLEWADDYEKADGVVIGCRDFGSEDEYMTKESFLKTMRGQTHYMKEC